MNSNGGVVNLLAACGGARGRFDAIEAVGHRAVVLYACTVSAGKLVAQRRIRQQCWQIEMDEHQDGEVRSLKPLKGKMCFGPAAVYHLFL